jgi:NitT/TauT family transport system substrate-binding protein
MDAEKRQSNPHTGKIVAIMIVAAIILIGILILYTMQSPRPAVMPEQLTIASGSPEFSALTLVAKEKGYFSKHGLNVTIRDYPTGALAINELLSGRADLAYAAEFVGVSTSFRSPAFKIIGSTAKSDVIALVVRNDRGIVKPSDLKGKIIAVPKGTAAEFYLGRYLTLNGMDIRDVTVKNLGPADLVTSVVSGDSDAAIIWEPYVYRIEQQLGRNGTTWPAQSAQRFYWVTYTTDNMIRDRPGVTRDYLRALDDAESFLYSHEPEGKEILMKHVNMSDDYIDVLWEKNQYVLSLDQGLVLAMEDEARWMKEENMTGDNNPPSYLDMISQDAMREVKPSAVTIIR